MEVEQATIASLRPDPRNPRRMPEHDAAALRRSLEEFGAVEPAVVNADGTIIGGHQRVEAARELGWTEFPVVRVDLDDVHARVLNLALNRIHGEWDESLLAEMLAELGEEDVDLALAGFDAFELNELLGLADATPGRDTEPMAVPDEPRTRPDDLWVLGEHRLLCGDALAVGDVECLLDGCEPLLTATDPPYGVELDSEWRDRAGVNTRGAAEASYMRDGEKSEDTRADWGAAFGLVASLMVAYVWHASASTCEVAAGLRSAGFLHFQQVIWDKGIAARTRTHYWFQHEPCWYARKKNAPWFGAGGTANATIWHSPAPKHIMSGSTEERFDHPTQKPLLLSEKPIENHTKIGDPVYEPFCGSGTTLIAAENLGRRCYAMEIDPGYCDVIVDRWERHTGRKAVRAETRTAEVFA